MKYTSSFVFAGLLLALSGPMAEAATVTVLNGRDDDFHGLFPGTSPGSAIDLAAQLPNFPSPDPVPNPPYIARGPNYEGGNYDALLSSGPDYWFLVDTTSFTTVTSAVVSFEVASVGRRSDGSGLGYASVMAGFYTNPDVDFPGTQPTGLGVEMLQTSTGVVGSAEEEMVREVSFDVTSLFNPGNSGYLLVRFDDSAISNLADLYAVDFGQVTVTGEQINVVPLPASFFLLAGSVGLFACLRRRSRVK